MTNESKREAVWYPVSGKVQIGTALIEAYRFRVYRWAQAVGWAREMGADSIRSLDGRYHETLN